MSGSQEQQGSPRQPGAHPQSPWRPVLGLAPGPGLHVWGRDEASNRRFQGRAVLCVGYIGVPCVPGWPCAFESLSFAVGLQDSVSPSVSATESCLCDHQPVGVSQGTWWLCVYFCEWTPHSGCPPKSDCVYEDRSVPQGSMEYSQEHLSKPLSSGSVVAARSCAPGSLCVGVCEPPPACV